jgi:molybdate/tungstate transport system substrate-binding protein
MKSTRSTGNREEMNHRLATLVVLVLFAYPSLLLAAASNRTVSVLYAGSLAAVMENAIGPAFVHATGDEYQGEAQGSLGAAQMIRSRVRTPDVFISSDPSVNNDVLMGSKNGNLVKWYVDLASSQLVIGYNPQGKFAEKFHAAETGKIPWYEVLETPGVRFGRGDPSIDPKGYRTLFLFHLAADHYHRPELASLPGDAMNPAQVFPEVVLMARVESGQFDAGIFYKHEVVAHKVPYISLPPEINLGASRFAAEYGKQTYTKPSGEKVTGSPILFTIMIPETVKHRDAAIQFVHFLLASPDLWTQFGFGILKHRISGDAATVPPELQSLANSK